MPTFKDWNNAPGWMKKLNPTGQVGNGWSGNMTLDYSNPELEAQLRSQGYGDLVDANPWKNLDYHKSGWQGFLGSLGFRTGADTAIENQQFQYNEYLANIQNLASQNQYNSEQEKAERMRSAGLNVDLQGLGDASTSSGLSEDTNNVLPNTDDGDALSKVSNFVMTGISMAVGFAKDVGALKQLSIANESGQLGNAQSMMNLAIEAILNHSPKEMPINSTPSKEEGDDITPSIRETPAWVVDFKSGMSNRQYRQFKKFVDDFWNDSARTDAKRYKDWRERMENRKSAFGQKADPWYSDEDDVLYSLADVLAKYQGRIQEKSLKNKEKSLDVQNTGLGVQSQKYGVESKTLSNELAYQNAIDPTLQAETENATNENAKQNAELDTDMNSMMAEIMKLLHDKADHGSKFASIALICFSVMRMMSVSRSSSTTSGPRGVTSSSSFNLGF